LVTISNSRLKFNRFGLGWREAEAIRLRGFFEFSPGGCLPWGCGGCLMVLNRLKLAIYPTNQYPVKKINHCDIVFISQL
jgi:hypothetical protein